MVTTTAISNTDDMIDSRDVIARIDYLKDETAECEHGVETAGDCDLWESHNELTALNALAAEGEAASDWQYGEILIRDTYFRDYAEELAEDCGLTQTDLAGRWPYTCIDWEAAAEALQADYVEVDFAGVSYWIQA